MKFTSFTRITVLPHFFRCLLLPASGSLLFIRYIKTLACYQNNCAIKRNLPDTPAVIWDPWKDAGFCSAARVKGSRESRKPSQIGSANISLSRGSMMFIKAT